ncbi:hypothetical protein SLEP1_g56980 [Rubroshorea leprosula]|uniref:Uncharacterized protein n=1 Tax=Rubroshorea leprosula TaxID=152421 RepID=A0AAV5MN35_9ROSI|nr:hypothetical protein SLEP1_g56980 [Rubroshorea leprosula]
MKQNEILLVDSLNIRLKIGEIIRSLSSPSIFIVNESFLFLSIPQE